jgi:hypothetical protein
MRAAALCLVTLTAGCDPAIDIEGEVLQEVQRGPVANARVYMADRVFHDRADDCLDTQDDECLRDITGMGTETDEKGRFTIPGMLAGTGRHDVWLIAAKDGMGVTSQRAWKGKGAPDRTIRATLLLPAE